MLLCFEKGTLEIILIKLGTKYSNLKIPNYLPIFFLGEKMQEFNSLYHVKFSNFVVLHLN